MNGTDFIVRVIAGLLAVSYVLAVTYIIATLFGTRLDWGMITTLSIIVALILILGGPRHE